MIVHGGLTLLFGLVYVILGPVLLVAISLDSHASKADKQSMPIIAALCFGCGAVMVVIAILNLVAGIRCLGFRSRTLALVAVFSNIPVIFTGYCAPTAIGVLIYGLIVFLNADVTEAFRMRERGLTVQEIRAALAPSRRYERVPDDDDDYERPRRRDDNLGGAS
jgi:hypothetical protein